MGEHHLADVVDGIIFVHHGLRGNSSHTRFLADRLQESYGPGVMVVNCKENEAFSATVAGVMRLSQELLKLALKTVEMVRKRNVSHGADPVLRIALVGYSLGGLIARCVAGLLYDEGVFTVGGDMHCAAWFYVSLATPHIGARRSPTSWFGRVWTSMAAAGGMIAGDTGREMVFADEAQIISALAQPGSSYMRALALFETRILVSNVSYDRTVGYRSASALPMNPYRTDDGELENAPTQPEDPRFPHVRAIWRGHHVPNNETGDSYGDEIAKHQYNRGDMLPAWVLRPAFLSKSPAFANDEMQEQLLAIIRSLATLQFIRIDADLKHFSAHGAIVVRTWFHKWAKDVIECLIDVLNPNPAPHMPPLHAAHGHTSEAIEDDVEGGSQKSAEKKKCTFGASKRQKAAV